jgi:hypothetical protein
MTCPDSQEALREFVVRLIDAAHEAGLEIQPQQIRAEYLPAPHRAPTALPRGKQAVYWFCLSGHALKVGRAGPNSGPRYTSQHYNPGSSQSNLARSILGRPELVEPLVPPGERIAIRSLTDETIGAWIKRHTARFNLLVDAEVSGDTIAFLEATIQRWLRPIFEGRGPRKPPSERGRARHSPGVTADDLARWRRCLRRLLEALAGGPDPQRGLKSWIMALSREGRIPRHVASAMILVAETRNVTEYEAVALSNAEAAAAQSAWFAVMAWAEGKRLTLPPECRNGAL